MEKVIESLFSDYAVIDGVLKINVADGGYDNVTLNLRKEDAEKLIYHLVSKFNIDLQQQSTRFS